MSDEIYLAGASLVSRQYRQEALVNNIANGSTPGYKAARVFAEVLTEVSSFADLQAIGRSQKQYLDLSQGNIRPTGRPLDFALDGDGYFVVLAPEGERYTRNGNFSIDGEGTLVTQNGHPVSGDGGPITIEGSRIEVSADGEILVDGESLGKLKVTNFTNPQSLARKGGSLFGPREGENLRSAEPTAVVCQNCLEESNVKTSEEMMRVLAQLRQFEASQKNLTLQSETLRRVGNELLNG